MIPGLNHNVRYRDRVFHVQTEDKGLEKHLLTTHVFIEGSVIAERHESYFDLGADQLDINSRNAAVRKRMQNLHKDCMKALLRGDFDDTIYRLGVLPRPEGEPFRPQWSTDAFGTFATPSPDVATTAPSLPARDPVVNEPRVEIIPRVEAPNPAESTGSLPALAIPIPRPAVDVPEATLVGSKPASQAPPIARSSDFSTEPTMIGIRAPTRAPEPVRSAAPQPDVTESPTLVGASTQTPQAPPQDINRLFPDGLPQLDSLPPLGAPIVSLPNREFPSKPPSSPKLSAAPKPKTETTFTDDLVLPASMKPSITPEVMPPPPATFASDGATDVIQRPDLDMAGPGAFALEPTESALPIATPPRSRTRIPIRSESNAPWPGAPPPSHAEARRAPLRAPSVTKGEDLDVDVDVVEDDALEDLEVVVDEAPIELGPEAIVDDNSSTVPGRLEPPVVTLPSFGVKPELRKPLERTGSFQRLPTMPPPATDMKELFHRISKPAAQPPRPAHAVRIPERSLDDIILGYLSGEREGEK